MFDVLEEGYSTNSVLTINNQALSCTQFNLCSEQVIFKFYGEANAK